jgi:hypothetical protein
VFNDLGSRYVIPAVSHSGICLGFPTIFLKASII